MMEQKRADPFAGLGDLSDFTPKPARKPEAAAEIRRASEAADFPSRAKPASVAKAPPAPVPVRQEQRRYRTGRNRQLNIKMTEATAVRIEAMADELGCVYGELIARALDALERETRSR